MEDGSRARPRLGTMKLHDVRIIVVGGGGSGAAISHDLVLRGFRPLLIERGSLTCGTTGRHHGLLHSGARYVVQDSEVARECWEEARILRNICSEVIEDNGGLHVALEDWQAEYEKNFVEGCNQCGIPIRRLNQRELLAREPRLSPQISHGYLIPDASFDAYRLPLQFLATAQHNGATIRQFCQLIHIETHANQVVGVRVRDLVAQEEQELPCDMLINATGVWGGEIAALAAAQVAITWDSGVMVAIQKRLANMVISRLAPPGSGDIIVPQRLLNIIGTTSRIQSQPDVQQVDPDEVAQLLANANRMIPRFSEEKLLAAWRATRPLVGGKGKDGRVLSRKMQCIDHAEQDSLQGMVSIIGGKATTSRAMAEITCNMVCHKLGYNIPCRTATEKLLHFRGFWHPRHAVQPEAA